MPPEEKPEGNVIWIGGYWAWDEDRQDYLWVSGCWRAKPKDREWVPGDPREQDAGWTWVGRFLGDDASQRQPVRGFLSTRSAGAAERRPARRSSRRRHLLHPRQLCLGRRPLCLAPGFWTQTYPGYVYVPAYYRWTPAGYIYVPGYWDQTLANRGLLYAPVALDFRLVGPRFVFCPGYAVTDVYLMDSLFIRPGYCHYYYGDYYGPRYVALGYEKMGHLRPAGL